METPVEISKQHKEIYSAMIYFDLIFRCILEVIGIGLKSNLCYCLISSSWMPRRSFLARSPRLETNYWLLKEWPMLLSQASLRKISINNHLNRQVPTIWYVSVQLGYLSGEVRRTAWPFREIECSMGPSYLRRYHRLAQGRNYRKASMITSN